jgi:cell division protease FtsH
VRELVEEAHQRAHQIISDHVDKLKLIASQLLKKETLEAGEFAALFDEGELVSIDGPAQGEVSGKSSSTQDQDTPPNVVPPSTAPLPA